MFDFIKSRQEFFEALKAGRINAALLQKAIENAGAFGDCSLDQVAWCLAQAKFKAFGVRLYEVCRDEKKEAKLQALAEKEARPQLKAVYMAVISRANPEAIFAAIAKLVNQKNVNQRKQAMQMLFQQANWVEQRGLVVSLIEDPVLEVRQAALQAVIRTAPQAYAGFLRQYAAHENTELRLMCLKALLEWGQVKHTDIFLNRLPFESGEMKKSLYNGIVALLKKDANAVTGFLLRALTANESEVRKLAMDLLLKMPNKLAVFREMLGFLDSVSTSLRTQVFEDAKKHGDRFAERILELIKTERNQELRLQAVHMARELKHPHLAPIFLHEMKSADWLTRYTAMQVLGEMKSEKALPVLIEAMADKQSAMAAIQALDKFRDIRLAKPFFQRLAGSAEAEQKEIVKALQNMGDPRLLSNLAKFLDSSAPKGTTKKFTAETILAMCKQHGKTVPPRIQEIHDSLCERTLDDLPDLGLKLSEER